VVYPAIDVIDGASDTIIKSANVVGGFDWGMNFKWEEISSTRILPSQGSDEDSIAHSPATPGIFALNAKYYADIGGIDTSLFYWYRCLMYMSRAIQDMILCCVIIQGPRKCGVITESLAMWGFDHSSALLSSRSQVIV
jgi:hypothetical protein